MRNDWFTRRDFARRVALGTGSLALAGTAGLAKDETPASDAEKESEQEAVEPPVPHAEDFLLASLLVSFPADQLSDEMLVEIRSGIRRSRQQAERLRTVPLDNSDEPATIFRAYRKE